MPWKSGISGNVKGRPRGATARVHREVRAIACKLFDQEYWQRKYEELHNGTCNPKIEQVLLSYTYDVPAKELHASGMIVHLGPLQALQGHRTSTSHPVTAPRQRRHLTLCR